MGCFEAGAAAICGHTDHFDHCVALLDDLLERVGKAKEGETFVMTSEGISGSWSLVEETLRMQRAKLLEMSSFYLDVLADLP